MARSTRKTRQSQRKPWAEPATGLTPAELACTLERMELYDSLSEEEALLVQEYGLAPAYAAIRQFYGQPERARQFLEARRQLLQSSRIGNT